MFPMPDLWMLMIVVLINLVGLTVTVGTRLDCECVGRFCKPLFFLSLVGIGIFAVGALINQSGFWLPSCTTFCVMVVGATYDPAAAYST